tara:strand:- start:2633 stop:3934 length:1302 start_codon:yes stop_codon:yes gene_type:complete
MKRYKITKSYGVTESVICSKKTGNRILSFNQAEKLCKLILLFGKLDIHLVFLKFVSFCLFSSLLLSATEDEDISLRKSDWFESPIFCEPIRMDDLDGGTLVSLINHPRATPLLFPKLVSPFEWIDCGEIEFYSFNDLIKNPMLREPAPRYDSKQKSPFLNENFSSDRDKRGILGPASNNEFDIQKLIQSKTPLPDDQKLLAFLKQGTVDLSIEQKTKILESLIPNDTDKDLIKNLLRPSRYNETKQIISSNMPAASLPAELPELPEIPVLDLPAPPPGFQTSTVSLADPGKTVLKLRASKSTTDGRMQPAQASDIYLTTQNLQELFKDLDAGELLAGEARSVAELWAKAEKSSNPEVVFGVKSILLQAKVGKTRTDAFGLAALEDLAPDEKYFLIGIEKDDLTDVVTIWSKEIEVSPGENMIELSSNDVIYQE